MSEDRGVGLPCTPVPAWVAEAGHDQEPSCSEPRTADDSMVHKMKRHIEEKEVPVNLLRKEIGEADKSCYDVREVLSPPRVCAVAREKGMRGGWSEDIKVQDPKTGRSYDLRNLKGQQQVKKMLRRDRPIVLVVAPP